MTLARRSLTAISWNVVANLSQALILYVRSVLLARWLPIEVFGVYAFASTVIQLTIVLPNFGMGGGVIHRDEASADESEVAASHLTLKVINTTVWAVVMLVVAIQFTTGALQVALIWLILIRAVAQMTQTPRLILTRRVVHRRLALLQLVTAVGTTVVSLGLALAGQELWALLATDLVTAVASVLLLYVWRPAWRARLGWSPLAVRYLLSFGRRAVGGVWLLTFLDRFDDFWTRIFLGNEALGLYSRAYTFATYPRQLLAAPISLVAEGSYAELKGDRPALSRAFFRTNAFLIRSGFLLAGLFALVAPEFIRLQLGEKWLPMVDAFRLMLIFTLFDPLKGTIAHLFTAVGRPEMITRTRGIQSGIMVAGVVLLGSRWGITGVALAVDLMLLTGIALFLRAAREFVDFSLLRMVSVPLAVLTVALGVTVLLLRLPAIPANDLVTLAAKSTSFVALYGGGLLLLERRQMLEMWRQLRRVMR